MKPPDIGVDEKVGAVVSLDLKFYDKEGKEQTLAQLINGKPVILALVYYRCPSICPITLHSLNSRWR
ncbi:MAG: SCO family protein [Candidatus Sumerlaeota bacterium]|nr:SCO family protein [Candidatus Sumerlaeota bacterium]